MISPKLQSYISTLPDTSGVYLFFGPGDQLLYVGKSTTLRTRVRSHFSSPDERWLCRRIRRIEIRKTPGELGALLLESRLIKELRPLHNVASKRRRRIVIARRITTPRGYTSVVLEAVERLHTADSSRILGIFKHTTQAKDYLAGIAKSHALCPKLLKLEQPRTYCFAYHLGRCNGACMGEEDPAAYNVRLETAFEERRIRAWPFNGSVVVEERSSQDDEQETFLIDNWCLLASRLMRGSEVVQQAYEPHRFDYDSYKILYSYLTDASNTATIRAAQEGETLSDKPPKTQIA